MLNLPLCEPCSVGVPRARQGAFIQKKVSLERTGFVHGNRMKGKYVIYVSKAVIKNTCNSKFK